MINRSIKGSGVPQQPSKTLASWKIPKKTQEPSQLEENELPATNKERSYTSCASVFQKNPTQALYSPENHSKCSSTAFKKVAEIPGQRGPQTNVSEKDIKRSKQITDIECSEQDTNIPYYNLYSFWMPLSNIPTLPDGWKIHRSNSRKNRVFFHNPISDEKTWECPIQGRQLIELFNQNDPRLEYILTSSHCEETKIQQNLNNSKILGIQDAHNQSSRSIKNESYNGNILSREESRQQMNSDATEKGNDSMLLNVYKLPSEVPRIEQIIQTSSDLEDESLKENTKTETGDKNGTDTEIPVLHTHEPEMNDVAPMDWEAVDEEPGQFEEEKMDTSQSWYIVVDTNVILRSPSFLNILKRVYNEDHGESRVVVPWIVLGELDSLKRKAEVRKEAIAATRYLRNHVFEKEDPRMIGQTFIDHQSLSVPNNAVNDDYILSTCVHISKSGMVTLLTNDVNLAVKAQMHKIDVKTGEEMKAYIRNKCKSERDREEINEPAKERNKLIKSAKMDDDVEKLNEEDENVIMKNLLPELKEHLRRFVSVVVEQGMRNTFYGIWESRCIRKPPWKLDDCLLCLKQHWVSIADNMDVPKINELRVFFNKHRKGFKLTTSEIRMALYLCLRLINSLPKEYSNFVDEFRCYFRDFQRKINLILHKEIQNHKDPLKFEDRRREMFGRDENDSSEGKI